ncbi:hypothetical protein N3K66_008522 [Trichothecium roseum]|uniref:Uncharacterized protein n=1 Tax=Trichothecium roseum TaxID=47278 RepID=A0ACC0UQM5_9HYPO|nr:hypothetical protein N3K66_008522 [Trichothecium roseum]
MDPYKAPVMPNPSGAPPDFHTALTDIQVAIIAVFSVTFFFATVSLVIRLFTVVRITRQFELDCLLTVVAYILALAYFIVCVYAFRFGFGQHAWNVSVTQSQDYIVWLIPMTLLYTWSPNLTKLAILSVLHRISNNRTFRACIYLLGISICGYCTAFTFIAAWKCNPTRVGAEGCTPIGNAAMAQVAVNAWADVMLILLPLPTLYKLQMPFRQKCVVACLLTLGSVVMLTSIIRVPYIRTLSHTQDFTAKQAEAGIWSIVEINFSILCSNLMRMKPFLNHYLPAIIAKLGLSSRLSDDKRKRVAGGGGGEGSWNTGYKDMRCANITIGGSERHRDCHDYQLHRLASDMHKGGERRSCGMPRDIRVVDEFSVHVESHARQEKDLTTSMNSTDSILPAAAPWPQGDGSGRGSGQYFSRGNY